MASFTTRTVVTNSSGRASGSSALMLLVKPPPWVGRVFAVDSVKLLYNLA